MWESFALGAGSGFASSALSLFGKRGPSERDLMAYQHDFWRKQVAESWPRELGSMRAAGVNPMLAVSKGGASTPGVSIAAPVDKGTDAAKLLMAGISSALEIVRTMADAEVKTEQAKLTKAQTETEGVRPGSVLAQTARDYEAASLSSAYNAHEKQKMGKTMIEMAIAREALTVAEKDAIIAAIDVDLYRSSVGELSRTLQQLGFTPSSAAGAAGALLKLFGVGQRKN